jgi:hypothetical protein
MTMSNWWGGFSPPPRIKRKTKIIICDFSLEMRIQGVGGPYQMAAFESLCLSYPVRTERAQSIWGWSWFACKECPLAGTNKVCES